MSLHYFAKVRSSSFGISGRKCRRKRNILEFLNTHNFNALNLLTCCFNFRFLLIFFVNCRWFYLNKCCKLKQRFLHVWHGIDQIIIDNAIYEWHGLFAHVCGQKANTSSNSTIVTIFSHTTRDISVSVKCDTIFRLFILEITTISYF